MAKKINFSKLARQKADANPTLGPKAVAELIKAEYPSAKLPSLQVAISKHRTATPVKEKKIAKDNGVSTPNGQLLVNAKKFLQLYCEGEPQTGLTLLNAFSKLGSPVDIKAAFETLQQLSDLDDKPGPAPKTKTK